MTADRKLVVRRSFGVFIFKLLNLVSRKLAYRQFINEKHKKVKLVHNLEKYSTLIKICLPALHCSVTIGRKKRVSFLRSSASETKLSA